VSARFGDADAQAMVCGARRRLTGLFAATGLLAAGPLAMPRPALAAGVGLAEAARRLARAPHVLLMRHAITEPGVGDPPGYRLDDCASQRNLSAEGREQSRRIGAALRAAGVTIGEVRTSAWCRCRDTAQLAFGRHERWSALNSFFDDRAAEPGRTAELRAFVAAHRGGSVPMMVTHQVNITAATGLYAGFGQIVAVPAEGGTAFALAPVG
jgi:phosphohistidine phosphatase SixA